jgi:DNA repair ATPase RecN
MIVRLSQEVCQQLQTIDDIETLKNNEESIKATLKALTKVKESVATLVTLLTLLRERLPAQDVYGLDYLVRELKASRERFDTEPRQTKALSSILESIQKLVREVKSQWQTYAKERVHEPLELLKLVENLPEVKAQREAYDELKTRLGRYTREPPLTVDQLTDFDRSISILVQSLNNIDGLNSEVKIFLQKTLNGEATLADLTDEVLQWCRQRGHARIFAVKFAR